MVASLPRRFFCLLCVAFHEIFVSVCRFHFPWCFFLSFPPLQFILFYLVLFCFGQFSPPPFSRFLLLCAGSFSFPCVVLIPLFVFQLLSAFFVSVILLFSSSFSPLFFTICLVSFSFLLRLIQFSVALSSVLVLFPRRFVVPIFASIYFCFGFAYFIPFIFALLVPYCICFISCRFVSLHFVLLFLFAFLFLNFLFSFCFFQSYFSSNCRFLHRFSFAISFIFFVFLTCLALLRYRRGGCAPQGGRHQKMNELV